VDIAPFIHKVSLEKAVENELYVGKLIRLEKVQFEDKAMGSNYYDETNVVGGQTNHLLVSPEGGTLIFRTSSFADFSDEKVSENSGSITGILTKYRKTYQLIVRFHSDINLNEQRF